MVKNKMKHSVKSQAKSGSKPASKATGSKPAANKAASKPVASKPMAGKAVGSKAANTKVQAKGTPPSAGKAAKPIAKAASKPPIKSSAASNKIGSNVKAGSKVLATSGHTGAGAKAAAAKKIEQKPAKPGQPAAKKAQVPAPKGAAAAKTSAKPPTPGAKTAGKAAAKLAAPAPAAPATKLVKVGQKGAAAPVAKKSPEPEESLKAKSAVDKSGEKSALKKGKPKKTEDVELEDDFIAEDDFGASEIGEYEEELKAVETLDEEVDDDLDWSADSKSSGEEDIYLTDADGNRYCRSKDCDQIASVDGYCRFHYLLFWKRIQVRKKILADGKLSKYVEELTARYPDKFLEMIRRDLRTQKDFLGAIQELEIDESENNSDAEEETQSFIDEVRGLGEPSGMEEEEF